MELAAALSADRCEIYSDVDGIYTADPRLVTGAVRLDRIDYGDMLRLALHGSQVLHSRSVEAVSYTHLTTTVPTPSGSGITPTIPSLASTL